MARKPKSAKKPRPHAAEIDAAYTAWQAAARERDAAVEDLRHLKGASKQRVHAAVAAAHAAIAKYEGVYRTLRELCKRAKVKVPDCPAPPPALPPSAQAEREGDEPPRGIWVNDRSNKFNPWGGWRPS